MPMDAREIESMIPRPCPTRRSRSATSPATATTTPRPWCRRRSRASRGQQHQMVYGALQGRMGGVLHALALTTGVPQD